MIVSHSRRFIFLKTSKTAGTSIEIALARHCGPEDVVTPLAPEDEEIRRSLSISGPRNYKVPLRRYTRAELFRAIRHLTPLEFSSHSSASFVRGHVDEACWNHSFKFCFERNPWDKAVSRWEYWRRKAHHRLSLSEFILTGKFHRRRGFDLYTEGSKVVVDRVYKYEELPAALTDIQNRLGFDEPLQLPHAKAGHRQDRRSYRELLGVEEREKIARDCAPEIRLFDYEF